MESILNSIKKVLGLDAEYDVFDVDLIMHINSVFSDLHQVGAAPAEGFVITDEFANWEDFIQDKSNIEMVKSYVAIRVKLLFDPPTSAYGIESLQKQADKFEWRLNLLEDVFNVPNPTEPPPTGFA